MRITKSQLTPELELSVVTSLNESTGKWENRLHFNGTYQEGTEVPEFMLLSEAVKDAQEFVTGTTAALKSAN